MQVIRGIAVLSMLACAGCVSVIPKGNVAPPRIALVGDSWPLIMRYHGGFKEAFVELGYRPRQVRHIAVGWSYLRLTEERLSFQGIETHRYVEGRHLDTLDEFLAAHPTIEIIHFTLGGPDLLHDIPPNLPIEDQADFLQVHVVPVLDYVLGTLVARYPDKLVALVGYDYLNFREARHTHARTQRRWEELGEPTPEELNRLMWELNEVHRAVAAKHPGVLFIDVLGLTKRRFGLEPDMAEPSPVEGMWKDGMHLSAEGNAALAMHCLEVAYGQRLMPLRDARGRLIVPTGRNRKDREQEPFR